MIPKLNINTALMVCDGSEVAGFIVRHDGAFFAYGSDQILIGEYSSQRGASRAIPKPAPQRANRRARPRTSHRRAMGET